MTQTFDYSSLSNESIEVIKRFGPEAPATLNAYACVVEDALLKSQSDLQILQQEVSRLRNEREQMKILLTDPEELIAYVSYFFGPKGPYPGGVVISRLHNTTTTR